MRGKELEHQSDHVERQADALLETANTYADLGENAKAIEWGREAERLYHESAMLARQAKEAYLQDA